MGNRLNCQVYFVANKDIPCNQDGQFQMIICKKEKDSADKLSLNQGSQHRGITEKNLLCSNKKTNDDSSMTL